MKKLESWVSWTMKSKIPSFILKSHSHHSKKNNRVKSQWFQNFMNWNSRINCWTLRIVYLKFRKSSSNDISSHKSLQVTIFIASSRGFKEFYCSSNQKMINSKRTIISSFSKQTWWEMNSRRRTISRHLIEIGMKIGMVGTPHYWFLSEIHRLFLGKGNTWNV